MSRVSAVQIFYDQFAAYVAGSISCLLVYIFFLSLLLSLFDKYITCVHICFTFTSGQVSKYARAWKCY